MAEISVQARSLALLLEALRETLGKPGENPGFDGVYLSTAMTDSPQGRTQTLTGVSTDGVAVGRLRIMCNGEFAAPVLIPAVYLQWMIEVLREVVRDDVHALVSLRIKADGSSAELIVETRANNGHLFPFLTSVSEFPAETCSAMLDTVGPASVKDKDGGEIPAGNLLVLPGGYLDLLRKMSRRFSSEVWLYRSGHPAGRVVARVGPWRGSFPAVRYPADAAVDFPEEQPPADMPAESDDSAGQVP